MQEIFKEIEIHVAGGVREVNLLGQNVNSYRYKENGDSAFYELLRCLGERFPETWIRFTTSHPRDFDLETIRSIADTANVCEYVHLPLQAGSNRIIEAMNRGYTAEEYLYKANAIRDMIEDVSLATDIMVGFPGESEDDFQETLEMVESCRFDTSYTFIYNPREGTDAAMVNDNVPKEVKQNRLERLMAITRKLTAESMQNEVGKDKLALVYAPSRKDPQQWTARTRNNKPVHFARTDANISGRIVKVSITAAGNWSLQGAILEVVG